MIVTENLTIDGRQFVKTYSDARMKIQRDGIQYDDATDPAELHRTYTETDIPIDSDESAEEIVSILLGGE